ncbi:hypothetical protein [Streptacidiphilus cavernicola]|uniref:Uncharacterized protein n=1 Tax=Streptacidiphilus cavernicola TaxID=3342716 RepID=A0ABV6VY95_9ACTN
MNSGQAEAAVGGAFGDVWSACHAWAVQMMDWSREAHAAAWRQPGLGPAVVGLAEALLTAALCDAARAEGLGAADGSSVGLTPLVSVLDRLELDRDALNRLMERTEVPQGHPLTEALAGVRDPIRLVPGWWAALNLAHDVAGYSVLGVRALPPGVVVDRRGRLDPLLVDRAGGFKQPPFPYA